MLEKVYQLSSRDKIAFKGFAGTVVHQKPLYVKYFTVGDDGKPVRDNGHYFYNYDELSTHRILFPEFDKCVFECYTIDELGDLTIQEETLKVGMEVYTRYAFASPADVHIPFFDALDRVETTSYRNYPFRDNQSLWLGEGSALYVNRNGKAAYNEETGRYMLGGVGISVELAAEHGMFDALAPTLRLPEFETDSKHTAALATMMGIFEEIQPLLWNAHRLNYGYTLYIYMEADETENLEVRTPISFYVVFDGNEAFRERIYQDNELVEKGQIAENDLKIRLSRANEIRKSYMQFQKEHDVAEKVHLIQAHVSYENNSIVNAVPELVSLVGDVNYKTEFEHRCFKALMRHFWQNIKSE